MLFELSLLSCKQKQIKTQFIKKFKMKVKVLWCLESLIIRLFWINHIDWILYHVVACVFLEKNSWKWNTLSLKGKGKPLFVLQFKRFFVKSNNIFTHCACDCTFLKIENLEDTVDSAQCGKTKNLLSPKNFLVKSAI